MKEWKPLTIIGTACGSMMAIIGLVAFLAKPFLAEFVDTHIETYDQAKKEEDSKKEKLRKLLGGKMGIEEDEVHIEIGKMYKSEKEKEQAIEDLQKLVNALRKEMNYYHPGNLVDDYVDEDNE
jgi:predicted metalloendopeptidase